MRTGSLILLRVQKRLCVSALGGKPSIYFWVNIGYYLRPSVVSRRVPSSLSSVRPSVRPVVRPVVRPLSVVRPVVRPFVRPLSVRPVVRPNITCKSSSILCPSVEPRHLMAPRWYQGTIAPRALQNN